MDVGSTYWALEEKICGILKSSFSTSKYHISTNCMGFWTTFLSFESKFIEIDRSIGILVFFPPGSEHIQTISWRLEIKRRSHLKVERPKASSQLLARYQERKDRETFRTFALPTFWRGCSGGTLDLNTRAKRSNQAHKRTYFEHIGLGGEEWS